jgi:adenylate cyclase
VHQLEDGRRALIGAKIAALAGAPPLPQPNTRIFFWIIALSAALGALFAHFEAVARGNAEALDAARGAVTGALISIPLAALELNLLPGEPVAALRRLPFLAALALRSTIYAAVILLGLNIGIRLLPTAGAGVDRRAVLFSVSLSVAFNLLVAVNQLLGPGVLFAFAAGRYRRPRLEQRVLLFIDMESSTAIAERLGEVRFLVLLNRFVGDISEPIFVEHGEIHKYVGDEVIATWKTDAGREAARAVRACFAALDRLTARAPRYKREFGLSVSFRAGLHCGPVVIGELGTVKQEIALLGDSMNTAARIQQVCRETGHQVVASAALMTQMGALPPGIVARGLGEVRLRGKETALALFALARG